MGRHGGAVAESQTQVLATLGVTEESVGCPILSSMETMQLGGLENGLIEYSIKAETYWTAAHGNDEKTIIMCTVNY